MTNIVVITGAGAGVGRAVATEFARNGFDMAILSRDPERLERAAMELRAFNIRVLPIPTDVADAAAVDAAAARAEEELGPISVWVNVAMATVFAPVHKLTAEEFQRGTMVTYLGQVHGVMAALRHMRPRNRGAIVCVGSALAYRSVPLQSIYCGAKFAIRGFLELAAVRTLSRRDQCDADRSGSPGCQYPAVRLGAQQDGSQGPACAPRLSAGGRGPRHRLWRASSEAPDLGWAANDSSDPRKPNRAGPHRPLPREVRLQRTVERQNV